MNITRDTFLDFYIDLSHSGYPLDYYTRQFSYYLKVDWLIYHEDLKDNINITRKKKIYFLLDEGMQTDEFGKVARCQNNWSKNIYY